MVYCSNFPDSCTSYHLPKSTFNNVLITTLINCLEVDNMAKDDSNITNNPKALETIIKVAKKLSHSNDSNSPEVIDKIDQIVTVLTTKGTNREEGRKAAKRGTASGYDEAVKK